MSHPFQETAQQPPNTGRKGIAVDKLNIVLAEGRDPRLVLDSTVCNANTLCRIPEHVALPSAHEVMKVSSIATHTATGLRSH